MFWLLLSGLRLGFIPIARRLWFFFCFNNVHAFSSCKYFCLDSKHSSKIKCPCIKKVISQNSQKNPKQPSNNKNTQPQTPQINQPKLAPPKNALTLQFANFVNIIQNFIVCCDIYLLFYKLYSLNIHKLSYCKTILNIWWKFYLKIYSQHWNIVKWNTRKNLIFQNPRNGYNETMSRFPIQWLPFPLYVYPQIILVDLCNNGTERLL